MKNEIRYAGLEHRLLALVVDFLVFCTAFFPITRIVKGAWIMAPSDHRWAYGLLITDPLCIEFLTVMFLYFVLLEGLGGATLGKWIVGLRVVRAEGGKPGLLKSALRNLLRLVDGLPTLNLTGTVLILRSAERARLGDRVAGTRVIRVRQIDGVYASAALAGLCIMLFGLRPSGVLVAGAASGGFLCSPIINGLTNAIPQSKVAPDVQGRVFGVLQMMRSAMMPPGFLIAGPLADRVFEPLLAVDGPLVGSVGRIVGRGPGRGIGLFFIVLGACYWLPVAAIQLHPRVRQIKGELPDAVALERQVLESSVA